jgi:siroheme synthase
MPLVSDPGYLLVQKLIQRNIPFEVVPGPTAATTAIEYFSSIVVDGDASIPASPVSRIYDTTSKLEVLKSRAAASYTAGGSFQAYTSGFYEAS